MKKTLLAVCALGLAAQLSCPVSASPDIEGLIRQMTLAEKFGQLQQLDGLAEGRWRVLSAADLQVLFGDAP